MLLRSRLRITAIVLALVVAAAAPRAQRPAGSLEPIQYTFRVVDPDKHIAGVEARIPTGGRAAIDLMMPVWTPGYYVVEDYAGRVQNLVARGPGGDTLTVSKPKPNRWQVQTAGSAVVNVSYTLVAQGRSVTSNWVDADLGVINGGAAFVTLAENARRPHDVRIEMPATWKQSVSGLEPAPGGQPNHYRAADFDTLADSPIVAGDLTITEFVVDGSTHVVADAGQHAQWNSRAGAAKLEKMVEGGADVLGGPALQAICVPERVPSGRRRARTLQFDAPHIEPEDDRADQRLALVRRPRVRSCVQRQAAATGGAGPVRLRIASAHVEPVVVGGRHDCTART